MKEGMKEGRKQGMKERKKEGKKEGRKEGNKDDRKYDKKGRQETGIESLYRITKIKLSEIARYLSNDEHLSYKCI